MSNPPAKTPVSGDLITTDNQLGLDDLCEGCGLTIEKITAYINEGLIEVEGEQPETWRFSYVTLIRIRKAARLERDLRLNPAGVSLALELMDEIDRLKLRLRRYE